MKSTSTTPAMALSDAATGTLDRIPEVDLSGLHDPQARPAIDAALLHAAETVGFVVLRNAPFPQAVRDRAFAESARFFAQSQAEKTRLLYSDTQANHGFVALGQEALDPTQPADRKESFTMRDVQRTAKQSARWPDPEFRDAACAMDAAARQLAAEVMAAFGRELGVPPDHFEQRHTGQNQTLRYLSYPGTTEIGQPTDDAIGAGAHTDYGSVTLLWQDGNGGLEVRLQDGRWFAVPPDPEAIVLNIGDLLERWTHGRLRSTLHRVRRFASEAGRQSIAFFSDPDDAVLIETLPSCLPADGVSRYPTVTAGEHIAAKLAATY